MKIYIVKPANLANYFFNDNEIWIAFAHVSDLEKQSSDPITRPPNLVNFHRPD